MSLEPKQGIPVSLGQGGCQELHQEALAIFPKLEQIIDELKAIEPVEDLNALPNIEDWLGQLSSRAHVQGSQSRYVRTPVK